MDRSSGYCGRIAPSPTGDLHVGHAITFWCAQQRARAASGRLVLRIEDLDLARCRPEFRAGIVEDLTWFGIEWDEGPILQSQRRPYYLEVLEKLHRAGLIYPCRCSRRDIAEAGLAPHAENEEPIYPGTCRPNEAKTLFDSKGRVVAAAARLAVASGEGWVSGGRNLESSGINWRFRVPAGEEIVFHDERLGEQRAIAGKDFGDFIIWRRDDTPAYQLAVVADDSAMGITEVVRGADLLTSTFRQLLIYRALNVPPPKFYHAALITDAAGRRLAKRDASLGLRALRANGVTPEEIRERYKQGTE